MPLQEELNVIVVKESALSPDAQWLIKELSEELSTRYGDGDSSSFKPEDTDKPKSCFVIARIESNAVGCGALMPFEDDIAEVKRMYVKKEIRGKGVSVKILVELEKYAKEYAYKKIWLETGVMQPEAIGLYEKAGYVRIKNYGKYENNPLSVCYEKTIE